MNILRTLGSWFTSAWSFVTGIPGDLGKGLTAMWHLIQNQHSVVSWIFGYPILRAITHALYNMSAVKLWQQASQQAQQRTPGWIWLNMIAPVESVLAGRINRLHVWAILKFAALNALAWRLYRAARAYAWQLTTAEHAAMLRNVAAEHAAMIKAVAACLATVQQQAASGYNSGLKDRLTLAGTLLNDLADRTPAIRGLVNVLVGLVVDLESIDNPVVRWTIGKLLSEIISHSGIDQATGDLLSRLLGPVVGQPKASGLFDVAKDVSARLDALEGEWGEFMTDGGPEVERAGEQWKAITSITADVALLSLFGLAVTDPGAWATGMADTIGTAGNATLTAVVDLIHAV